MSSIASIAVQMIIAHESKRGQYIEQIDGGPALGWIQMEPTTHDTVWEHGDSVWENADLMGIVTSEQLAYNKPPPAERLLYDMRYNVFMARQRLFMKPERFPTTLLGMSAYLKKHWNTTRGAADNLSYLHDWESWK
ncbi:MAG: hypothetical protein GY776_15820 [Alteromonas sp.]|nr:hypothetical protein [Alteromonas sp.]